MKCLRAMKRRSVRSMKGRVHEQAATSNARRNDLLARSVFRHREKEDNKIERLLVARLFVFRTMTTLIGRL